MFDFLLYALVVGIGIALIAGPLGAFMVWRRMSYFGDTLAHSALIGVAFGLMLEVDVSVTIIFACTIIAVALIAIEKKTALGTDTVLGVLSHGSLALGLIFVTVYADSRVNLYGYLFGDLLSVNKQDLFIVYGAIAFIATLLFSRWKEFVMLAVDEDLAQVEGLKVTQLKFLLMIMIACMIALAMKIVGVLLITALLIIPSATARRVSSSPEAMAAAASVIGICSVCGGLWASYEWDIPAGPAIVTSALGAFIFSTLKKPA